MALGKLVKSHWLCLKGTDRFIGIKLGNIGKRCKTDQTHQKKGLPEVAVITCKMPQFCKYKGLHASWLRAQDRHKVHQTTKYTLPPLELNRNE